MIDKRPLNHELQKEGNHSEVTRMTQGHEKGAGSAAPQVWAAFITGSQEGDFWGSKGLYGGTTGIW